MSSYLLPGTVGVLAGLGVIHGPVEGHCTLPLALLVKIVIALGDWDLGDLNGAGLHVTNLAGHQDLGGDNLMQKKVKNYPGVKTCGADHNWLLSAVIMLCFRYHINF